MVQKYDTEMGGYQASFSTTHWTLLEQVRGPLTSAHKEILNLLIKQYWKPVYCFIRQKSYDNEQAKDLTQGFFVMCLTKELFGRADSSKGRFRSFLVKSLENFLKNARRADFAKCRCPTEGIISLGEAIHDEDLTFEPDDNETPEAIFNRVWLRDLLLRVSNCLEQEFHAKGQEVHYELFRLRVIEPTLDGTTPPSLHELSIKYDITKKEVSNRVITARRAFQRLLRNHIRYYACSREDVTAEVQDMFEFISQL